MKVGSLTKVYERMPVTMFFLAIDTATNCGGVAVSRNAEVIGVTKLKNPLKYSDRIIYWIDFLLEQLDIELGRIDCVIIASGPGSFTGLRIGIATAKALCQSLHIPGIGISTLEALAYRFRFLQRRVATAVDARRQQVYGAVYEVSEEGIAVRQGERVMGPADWLKQLPVGKTCFVGDAAQMYSRTIGAIRPKDKVLRTDNSILEALCLLGYRRYLRGDHSPAERIAANYVRPSDAEIGQK